MMHNDVISLPNPLERILATWRTHMIARDLTERTITERVRFMQQVDAFVGGAMRATRHDLIEFLGSNTAWANSTRAHYRSTLYAFYTWLQDEELRADNPAAKLPKVKPRRRKPTPLTHGDIVSTITSGAYYRTRVMIALHYYALMRVHEIAKIHGRDVDRQNRLLIVFGKGKKTRVVPIANELWEIVKDLPEDGYWFPNWKANKLYAAGEGHVLANSVSRLIGQAIRRGGVVGHRPHDLRASGITAQIAPGEVNILTVQDNAGHDSPATTQLYNLVTIEQKREAIELIPAVEFPQHSGRHSAA